MKCLKVGKMIKTAKKTSALSEEVDLKKQIEDLTGRWKRALADYQNLEKRQLREKEEFVQYAAGSLTKKFLSVLDHLEKAQEHLKDAGLDLAVKEFKRVLEEEGIAEIEVLGKEFDPMEMEAVEMIEGEEDNKVAAVITKGYRLKNKVIRPAKDKVSKKVNNLINVGG